MKKLLTVLCLCAVPLFFSALPFALGQDAGAFPPADNPSLGEGISFADTSPGSKAYVPKAIWAQAGYGGEWVTDILVHDVTGGSQVSVQFYYGAALARPYSYVWDNSGGGPAVYRATNILKVMMDNFDTGFDYYNKVGALYMTTQDTAHKMHVEATTYHSNNYNESYNAYSATFGQTPWDGYSAAVGRPMKIWGLEQGSNRRSNVVVFNPYTAPLTVQFKVIGHRYLSSCGLIIIGPPVGYAEAQYGITFTKNFVNPDFQVFNPFTEAGCETTGYCSFPFPGTRTYNYWVYLLVTPTSGTGEIVLAGAVAYNDTQDPATLIPVQVN